MKKTSNTRFWWLMVVCIGLLNVAVWQRERVGDWIGRMAVRSASQDSPQADFFIRVARRLHPDSPEAAWASARQARRASEMVRFKEELNRARFLGLPPEKVERESWYALAQSGQMRLVRDKLAQLTRMPDGDETEIYEAFAIGFMRGRDFSSSLTLLDAWAQDFPRDARPHAWIGQIYSELKDLEKAEDSFRKALMLDKKNSSASLGLGQLLLEVKRPEEAFPHFQIAAENTNIAPAAAAGWADSLLALGKPEEAERVLLEFLKERREDYQLLTSLANLYVEQGRFDEAEELLRPEIELGCRRRELRYAYALALRGLGKTDEAISHFDYASLAASEIIRVNQRIVEIETRPQDLELRFDIGSTFLKYGNTEDGLMWLQAILELEPSSPNVHRALGEFYLEQVGRDPQASVLARQHFALAETFSRSDRGLQP